MTITAARLRLPWLAPTAAAPTAALPIAGTPAHEAITATNNKTYSHQSFERLAEVDVEATSCNHPSPIASIRFLSATPEVQTSQQSSLDPEGGSSQRLGFA